VDVNAPRCHFELVVYHPATFSHHKATKNDACQNY
jgi:hypothetical protein